MPQTTSSRISTSACRTLAGSPKLNGSPSSSRRKWPWRSRRNWPRTTCLKKPSLNRRKLPALALRVGSGMVGVLVGGFDDAEAVLAGLLVVQGRAVEEEGQGGPVKGG